MKSTKRKLALLAGAALATMAFGATSASAATTVKDANGNLCPAVSPAVPQSENLSTVVNYDRKYQSGGCTVHVEIPFPGGTPHIMGIPSSGTSSPNQCYSEFDVHVGPDGWGYANNFSFPSCSRQTESCAGDRVITPVEWNPSGFFKYSNAATDLQIGICGRVLWNYGFSNHWGLVSMDITTSGGVQSWTNQQTSSPTFIYQVVGGQWTAEGPGLTITH